MMPNKEGTFHSLRVTAYYNSALDRVKTLLSKKRRGGGKVSTMKAVEFLLDVFLDNAEVIAETYFHARPKLVQANGTSATCVADDVSGPDLKETE